MSALLKDSQVSVRLPNNLKDKMEAYARLTGRAVPAGARACPHGRREVLSRKTRCDWFEVACRALACA